MIESERRAVAPHPGPKLKAEYFDALGVDTDSFARDYRIDPERFAAMLAGKLSIDVDTSLRIARALEISAERIMRMQVRHDFAAARNDASVGALGTLVDRKPRPFPEYFLCGRLGRSSDVGGEAPLFFQQDLAGKAAGDPYAGLHALWRGDRLRIYGSNGEPIWIGPILADLDDRIMLPFARREAWLGWFDAGYRADLAFGADHAAFFERMESGTGV